MSHILTCISPIDGSVFAEREALSRDAAAQAVQRARAAQADWAARPLKERIDRVIADDAWEVYVNRLRGALKDGRGHEELLAVLRDVGAILAEKFPPRADDTNELSNEVVVE